MYKIFEKYSDSMTDKLINSAVAIIWDWNGTLLNDLEVCIGSMNTMLEQRAMAKLTNEHYKEIFTFPVRDYYEKAGFDFSIVDWEEVAMEFINNYRNGILHSLLHDDAVTVLDHFRALKKRQFVLSAMQQDFLMETISARLDPSIFEIIAGLNDHYAATKVENAHLLVKEIGLPTDHILMIGDTIHDFEVAEEVGIRCILVANGHQSRQRLEKSGAAVIDSLLELL
jgi:phosphoglycolate phosphatase